MPDGHRTAELRSIELHRRVAARLDDALVARARQRVCGWQADPARRRSAQAWLALLDGPSGALAAALVRDDERMRDLRQDTPFAGVVPEPERRDVIRSIA